MEPKQNLVIRAHEIEGDTIIFTPENGHDVITLTKEGMYYMGEFVEDAGRAHELMLEFLYTATNRL